MKKLLLFTVLFTTLAMAASAQYTTPRFGIPPAGDNTGRVLNYNYTAQTFANALQQFPNAFKSIYSVGMLTHALTDSIRPQNAHVGDEVTLLFLCDTLTAGRVVTFTQRTHSTGTLTVAQNKRATITFIFDGTYWLEEKRAIGL